MYESQEQAAKPAVLLIATNLWYTDVETCYKANEDVFFIRQTNDIKEV